MCSTTAPRLISEPRARCHRTLKHPATPSAGLRSCSAGRAFLTNFTSCLTSQARRHGCAGQPDALGQRAKSHGVEGLARPKQGPHECPAAVSPPPAPALPAGSLSSRFPGSPTLAGRLGVPPCQRRTSSGAIQEPRLYRPTRPPCRRLPRLNIKPGRRSAALLQAAAGAALGSRRRIFSSSGPLGRIIHCPAQGAGRPAPARSAARGRRRPKVGARPGNDRRISRAPAGTSRVPPTGTAACPAGNPGATNPAPGPHGTQGAARAA